MEEFSRLTTPLQVSWRFQPGSWAGDHCYKERAVLPAVDSLRLLADCLRRFFPGHPPANLRKARFKRFLHIDDLQKTCVVTIEFSRCDGGIRARLLRRLKGSRISRMLEYAEVCFNDQGIPPEPPPLLPEQIHAAGNSFVVEPQRLYRDLVPFGPAYHTVRAPIVLAGKGAAASLVGRSGGEDKDLGSPFYLDGAFHVACAWGQRYAEMVTFPVAIGDHRTVLPVAAGTACWCLVLPGRIDTKKGFLADIWIVDDEGNLRETAVGVEMRDVSKGQLRPPEWIREKGAEAVQTVPATCK